MAKIVPEVEKNYNKFPGEHVIVIDDLVRIGDKAFQLVHNYRDGFDAETLEQRFSDLFIKYDYIVGDWGHEQLRLKGFFSTSRKKMADDLKITHLEDYVKEYMNFGAAFFVLKRKRAQDIKRDEAYVSERVYEVKTQSGSEFKDNPEKTRSVKKEARPSRSKQADQKKRHSKQQGQSDKRNFVKKDKSSKSTDKQVSSKRQNASPTHSEGKRPTFVVRTRNQ